MARYQGKLGRKKEQAIIALLQQRSVEDAARMTDVSIRTLYRWMKDPDFDAAYREAKRASFSQSVARLHQMASAAVTTMGKIMVDPSMPASTRVKAAECILSHTTRAVEIETIETRLEQLESSVTSGSTRR